MDIGAPSVFLVWSFLSCLFLLFLLFHLWCYDRFQCVLWGSGHQPGAFKRLMTYTYLATVPLLAIFSVATTVLKYQEGFLAMPGKKGTLDVIPKPVILWDASHASWVIPLYCLFSVAWGLEIVTHLEELAFWLFLLHQGSVKRFWFQSWEYRAWCICSVAALVGLPLTAALSKGNIERAPAWIFLVGSVASTLTTVSFLYVLVRFPGFLRDVKAEGATPVVVGRLTLCHHLNLIRVVFRFLFSLPLLALSLDALVGRLSIVTNLFWSDFLLTVTGFGCFVSSAITLLIFFPRTLEDSSEMQEQQQQQQQQATTVSGKTIEDSFTFTQPLSEDPIAMYNADKVPVDVRPESDSGFSSFRFSAPPSSPPQRPQREIEGEEGGENRAPVLAEDPRRAYPPLKSFRRDPSARDIESWGVDDMSRPSAQASSENLHPYLKNFTSPIDFPGQYPVRF